MMLRSSSMIRSEKLHPQNLSDVDRIVSPFLSWAVVRTGSSPTMMGRSASMTSRTPHSLIVIAENLQHDVTTRARESKISSACRRLGSFDTKILRFGGLELEPSTHARARRRRSLKSISRLVEDDPVFRVASTCVPAFNLTPLSSAFTSAMPSPARLTQK